MRAEICYIVGAGADYGLPFRPQSGDCVIAADGGLSRLEAAGLRADLVIGDFDSLGRLPNHPNVIALKPEKDETDLFAAVREGLSRGFRTFHLYGGTGGRMDHTLANIQLLAFLARQDGAGFLFDQDCVMTALQDSALRFPSAACGILSVFSLSDRSSGVTLQGLKYELNRAELNNTFSLGVSNEFTGRESLVCVERGTLLVVFPRSTFPEYSRRAGGGWHSF